MQVYQRGTAVGALRTGATGTSHGEGIRWGKRVVYNALMNSLGILAHKAVSAVGVRRLETMRFL